MPYVTPFFEKPVDKMKVVNNINEFQSVVYTLTKCFERQYDCCHNINFQNGAPKNRPQEGLQ